MKRTFILLFAAWAVSVSSCTTDFGYVPTRTQLLSKTWAIQQVAAISGKVAPIFTKGAKSNVSDLSKLLLNINSDGTFEQTNPDGKKTTGTWGLKDNSTAIFFTDQANSSTNEYRLAEIIDKHLTLKAVIEPTSIDPTSVQYLQVAKALKLNPEKDGLEMAFQFAPK